MSITTYRVPTEAEAALVEDIAKKAEEVGGLVAALRVNGDLDQRWLSIGATHLQEGFMALTRGVLRPVRF